MLAIVVATNPFRAEAGNRIGLIGGIVGILIGILGSMLGLMGSVMGESRSSQSLTYWPSKSSPWQARDWVIHLLFISSYLALLFCLIYAQLFSPSYPYKPLWFVASLDALSALLITSIVISYRVTRKANRTISSLRGSPP